MQLTNPQGKVLTTYLIDGQAQGLKSIFFENSTIKTYVIPRIRVKELNLIELQKPALYILIGENEQIYIGETENFIERIKDHNRTNSKQDFWDEVLVFISSNNSLTKVDVQYLEYLAIKEAENANLEANKSTPKIPHLLEHRRVLVEGYYVEIIFFVSYLNYEFFDKAKTKIKKNTQNLFYCKYKTKNVEATGVYQENGFLVLQGAKVANEETPSFKKNAFYKKRQELLQNNTQRKNDHFVLLKDIKFKSPSAASTFCLGNSSNGCNDWKNEQGKTLSALVKY